MIRRAQSPDRPAGVVTRTMAACVDALVVWIIVAGIYVGWSIFKLLIDPRHFTWPDAAWWMSMTAAMGVATMYFTVFWAVSGRTVGGAIFGTRVISSRHRVLRWASSLVRAAFCVVFPIGLAWSAVDRRRRSIQDVVLRTEVVYDWTTRTKDEVAAAAALPPIVVEEASPAPAVDSK